MAATVRPDWKISYYKGLIYWANQNREKALSLFNDCGETGYAPFYLSRASLKSGEEPVGRLAESGAGRNVMAYRVCIDKSVYCEQPMAAGCRDRKEVHKEISV